MRSRKATRPILERRRKPRGKKSHVKGKWADRKMRKAQKGTRIADGSFYVTDKDVEKYGGAGKPCISLLKAAGYAANHECYDDRKKGKCKEAMAVVFGPTTQQACGMDRKRSGKGKDSYGNERFREEWDTNFDELLKTGKMSHARDPETGKKKERRVAYE